jgi:hypothetical protein
MSEEQSTEQPGTPSYIRYASISGVIALVLSSLFVCYVAFAIGGWAPPPKIGVVSTWMALILLSTVVKVCQVMATAAAKPAERQIALLRADLREAMAKLEGDALRAAHDSGQWKGMAQAYREGTLGPEATGDVVPLGIRRRNGG